MGEDWGEQGQPAVQHPWIPFVNSVSFVTSQGYPGLCGISPPPALNVRKSCLCLPWASSLTAPASGHTSPAFQASASLVLSARVSDSHPQTPECGSTPCHGQPPYPLSPHRITGPALPKGTVCHSLLVIPWSTASLNIWHFCFH